MLKDNIPSPLNPDITERELATVNKVGLELFGENNEDYWNRWSSGEAEFTQEE